MIYLCDKYLNFYRQYYYKCDVKTCEHEKNKYECKKYRLEK